MSSLLADTWNTKNYSPPVLIHFAYPLSLITYKNRWDLQISVHILGEKNHQQRNHQKLKTQVQQETPHKKKKDIKETTPLNLIEFLP